ncbi:hypothetical protein AB1I63_00645 [Streptococcus pneumoniae]
MWGFLGECLLEFILSYSVEHCQTRKKILVISLVRNLFSLLLCLVLGFAYFVSIKQGDWRAWLVVMLLSPFLIFHLLWCFFWNTKSVKRFKELSKQY